MISGCSCQIYTWAFAFLHYLFKSTIWNIIKRIISKLSLNSKKNDNRDIGAQCGACNRLEKCIEKNPKKLGKEGEYLKHDIRKV